MVLGPKWQHKEAEQRALKHSVQGKGLSWWALKSVLIAEIREEIIIEREKIQSAYPSQEMVFPVKRLHYYKTEENPMYSKG